MDLYEDRKGFNKEPLGEFAWKLFSAIKAKNQKIVITDLLIKELEVHYVLAEINGMVKPFEKIVDKIFIKKEQDKEAEIILRYRNIPKADVLHAIIARDYQLVLVARDKHFKLLRDISESHKPEELI